jgi:hypothetical protein
MRPIIISMFVSLAYAMLATAPALAATVRLPCIADTNLSSYPSEVNLNYGHSPRLRLKGIQMLALFRFALDPVRTWNVDRARLFLHAAGPNELKTVGVSTIAVDWAEGSGTGTPEKSGATFTWADFGRRRWGGPQSDFTDAALSADGTNVYYTDIQEHEGGWLSIETPPAFITAMLQGKSFGLAVTDEKGQTQANNDVHSREQAAFAPYLEVTGQPEPGSFPVPLPAPNAPGPVAATIPAIPPVPRVAPISWAGGEPPIRAGGLTAWAYGDCEKVDAVAGHFAQQHANGNSAATARQRSSVWDGATSTVHLAGARNEFVAFQLCLETAGKPVSGIHITAGDLSGPANAHIDASHLALFHDWCVKDGDWYPEVAVPLQGPINIPDPANAIPGQTNASIFADLYIPHSAKPGLYHGELIISADQTPAFQIPISLTVWNLLLPDTLSFQLDLNAYGAPEGTAASELAYQRMAHEHRATLSILGYSQSGTPHAGYVPPLEGAGKTIRVKDWTEFDQRFGPYFDGSAFADLPRKAIPVEHAYLPFCEGWPADIRAHYHYTPTVLTYPGIIVEHALKAPTIEQAFDSTFKDEMEAIVRQFAEHFQQKGWTRTRFEFFMNDKYYFRDPKQGGRGSSWWLLDEPMNRDDWLALQFFGGLFKDALKSVAWASGPRPQMIFRADVSRPQWQRDWLNGLVDLECVSGEFFSKNQRCLAMKKAQDVTFWNYASGNDIRMTNLTEDAWALKAYLAGADGIVPWDSIGSDEAFLNPTPTALLYPGRRFGVAGPLASLRLKALRRGQQDVEYMALLARSKGWARSQIAAWVEQVLSLPVQNRSSFVDDAGQPVFQNLDSEQFERLRMAVAAELQPSEARTGPVH